MRRALPPSLITALLLCVACDGGDAKKADAKKADTKQPDAKTPDAKQPDAETPDAKQPDAKTPAPAATHFDIAQDKSGILARQAAALEGAGIDNEALRGLSHHTEGMPSFEALCKHEAEVGKTGVAVADCVKAMEHHIVNIGPEIYAQFSACVMAASDADGITACHVAEQEAERLLHAKPHGDGLHEATCEQLFTQFGTLAKQDAGEHGAHVDEVLAEVRADVIIACREQGTKAEVECAMEAKTMGELNACASKLL